MPNQSTTHIGLSSLYKRASLSGSAFRQPQEISHNHRRPSKQQNNIFADSSFWNSSAARNGQQRESHTIMGPSPLSHIQNPLGSRLTSCQPKEPITGYCDVSPSCLHTARIEDFQGALVNTPKDPL